MTRNEMMSVALVVNRNDSRCGACGKGADPDDTKHTRILSWGDRGPGCGVQWTHVTSDYVGFEEDVQAGWSHLTWFPQFGDAIAFTTGEEWDAPGCQMCGAPREEPCDCHDPQAARDRCDYTAVEYDQGIDPNAHP